MARNQNPSVVVPNAISRESGPAITLIGSGLWKLLSVLGNVDFVFSLGPEKAGAIMQAFLDWGWIAAIVISLVWGWNSYRARNVPENAQEGFVITSGFFASGCVVSLLFGVLLAVSSSHNMPNLIVGWGPALSPTGFACSFILDTTPIKKYEGKYMILGVCGVADPTVDAYTDQSVTISRPFTITGSGVQILAPMSAPMASKVPLVPPTTQSPTQNPVQANVPSLWYKAAIVPKDADMSRIKTLMDIKREGGKVFDPALWN